MGLAIAAAVKNFFCCGRAERLSAEPIPENASSRSVAAEADRLVSMVAVEALDCVVKATLGT